LQWLRKRDSTLKAAGNLQRNERGNRELFTSPVDPKFVTVWREFERRFGHALLVVRSNAVEAGEWNLVFSFDWYEQPVNPEALSKDGKAAWTKFREAQAVLGVEYDRVAELMRSGDENTRRALAELTQEFRKEFFGDDPRKLVEWAISHWKKLKDEVGFDLRGVFRRRALVPFILFPRHVAARHGQTEMLSIYQNLRQAHEAFVFGTPFAALSLMRSIMEIVLRDHYGADGGHTQPSRAYQQIQKSASERGECCGVASFAEDRKRNSSS
jgi:hypothetical protein